MQPHNSVDRYSLAARTFHWLIAALIITLLGIGWWMVDLSYYDPWYNKALNGHKSLGILVGFLVILKLVWSLPATAPDPLPSLSGFERLASTLVHFLLRLTMLLLPVTGYLISSSEGAAIEVFDWFELPAILTISEAMRDFAIELHYYFAYGTLGLLLLHIGAALKHQFFDHNHIFRRIL